MTEKAVEPHVFPTLSHRDGEKYRTIAHERQVQMKDFLARLDKCRNGMSVSAFSRLIGMNQKTVDLYTKGERKPSVELVVAVVARLLRVSVSTVRRIAREGPGRRGAFDLRLCEPVLVGGMRRWAAAKVYAALGIG